MQRFAPSLLGDGIDASEHLCQQKFSEGVISRSPGPSRRNHDPRQYRIGLPQIGYDGGLAPPVTAEIIGDDEDRPPALTSSTREKVVCCYINAFPYLGAATKGAI